MITTSTGDSVKMEQVTARMETTSPFATPSISVSQQQKPLKFAPVVAPKPKFDPYRQLGDLTQAEAGGDYPLPPPPLHQTSGLPPPSGAFPPPPEAVQIKGPEKTLEERRSSLDAEIDSLTSILADLENSSPYKPREQQNYGGSPATGSISSTPISVHNRMVIPSLPPLTATKKLAPKPQVSAAPAGPGPVPVPQFQTAPQPPPPGPQQSVQLPAPVPTPEALPQPGHAAAPQVIQPAPALQVASAPAPPQKAPGSAQGQPEDELDRLTKKLIHDMDNPPAEEYYGSCSCCGENVVGDGSGCTAMEQVFHVRCFVCVACGLQLCGKPFYAVEKKPFCEPCYIKTLETCTVCAEPIMERILRATDRAYHPHCFTCVVCHRCLDGIPFTVDTANHVHCIEDFHKKFAPRCSVCKEPIMPTPGQEETVRIVSLDRDFHVQCYHCEDCNSLLSEGDSQGCYPLDGHVLCKACNSARVKALSAKASTDL
ncbi:lipoma-preferred partner isoform X3 [Conger conger]|uniref:lipoma-preferred partner isoform X3 n=1 Tax=Conger conger TaxID=82655 RepID=UPI002A5A59F5|nr:lipoma-preferred partner isoform X3 [Conger conger]